eukprot:5977808-Prymnesium_polylepis.1
MPNHLAWLKLKPIVDRDRLMVALRAYQQSMDCTHGACSMCDQSLVGASSSGTPRGILKPPDERKLDASDDTAVSLEAKKRKAQSTDER